MLNKSTVMLGVFLMLSVQYLAAEISDLHSDDKILKLYSDWRQLYKKKYNILVGFSETAATVQQSWHPEKSKMLIIAQILCSATSSDSELLLFVNQIHAKVHTR